MTTSRASHPRALAIPCAIVILVAAALVLTFGHGRDQAIYSVVARSLLEGGTPYRDAWDFKPPGIFFVYALARALFGRGMEAIRVLEVLGLCATSIGMVALARRWWGSPAIGWVAAALAALIHAQLDFWHTAQPETFGGMLVVAGLLVGAVQRPTTARLVGAGVLFGLAGLLKPPLAGAGAVFAFWDALRRWRDLDDDGASRAAAALVPIGAVLVGGILPFALTLAWFASRGALDDLHRTFVVFTPRYTQLGWSGQGFLALLYRAATEWLIVYSSAITLGVLITLTRWRQVATMEATGLLAAIVGIQLVGVALQAKFFPYHFAGTWPVGCLLVAIGWVGMWQDARRSGRAALAAATFLSIVGLLSRTATKDVWGSFLVRSGQRARLFLLGRGTQDEVDALATVADVNAIANRQAATFLREHTPDGAPIYVWGFEPTLYDQAERPACTRYIYNVPQRVSWSQRWARPELLDDLARRPPAAIVVVDGDVMWQVTGDTLSSANLIEDPMGFEELRALLLADYRLARSIEDLDVYLPR